MLSMYIGNEKIKVLQATFTGGNLSIKRAVMHNIAKKDTSKVEDRINAVVPAIYNCVNENKIRQRAVHLIIDDSSSLYRELVVPKCSDTEVKAIVHNEMSQILANINDYVVDYVIAYEFIHNNKTMYKVSITALSKNIMSRYVNMVKSASLRLVSMNTSANGYGTLMKSYGNYLSDLPYILLDIEDSFINLVLFEQGLKILSRSIDLTNQLANGFDDDVMTSTICDNVNRMMQFQMTLQNHKPVSRLYITGILPDEYPIEKRLANNFNLGIGVLPRPPFLKNSEVNINHFSNLLGVFLK